MQQEQIKTLLVNIATGAVVAGVFVAGYLVFVKNGQEPVVSSVVMSPEEIAVQTGSIGADIARTVNDLEDLNRAVQVSATVFNMAEFKNLEDLSVRVSAAAVGRENPFVPADWKIKLAALEEALSKQTKKAGADQATPSIPQDNVNTQLKPQSQTPPISQSQTQTSGSSLDGTEPDASQGL